ncbi:spore cortex biosynthesis protein YabQ [Paenibacillus sp. NEAU-GSW1]|uniref:spore cortex biosynthesis protein YabQ n=1 Tax=Paenibacillus sp. NEAU-GSW1 TaxID=2682486 RepID=UPI0012E1B328|nr:spore cortex biosynthesis protein YabQ [Paenibacillus sp. NEAU-GSW1]MUT67687.1 spore cortex biosynthesis protein YabQ [Paenibacillus sp. NEAU-GSW1]
MTLGMQWFTMAAMLLSGIAMGAVFDGYRVVSNELRFPKWWLPVLDMMYWVAAALLIFRVLYASNYGEVRAYVFVGLLIGVLGYYWLLSKAVIAIVKWVIEAVRKLIRFIIKCVDVLIVKPIILLYKLIRVIVGFGTALTIFLLKIVLQLVRPFWLLLRWMLRPLVRPLWRKLGPMIKRWQLPAKWGAIVSRIANLWKRLFKRE